MRRTISRLVLVLAVTGCGAPAVVTATTAPSVSPPAPPPTQCTLSTRSVTGGAPSLVLTPDDVGGRLSQISAQPVAAATLGDVGASVTGAYKVVFSTADNSERIVSQVFLTTNPDAAAQLLAGTESTPPASPGAASQVSSIASGASTASPPPAPSPPPASHLCDRVTTSAITVNGRQTYAVSWQHGNVFAEVVEYRAGVSPSSIGADLAQLSAAQDARISAALAAAPLATAAPSASASATASPSP